jgi:hypothetical protein
MLVLPEQPNNQLNLFDESRAKLQEMYHRLLPTLLLPDRPGRFQQGINLLT